MSSFLNINEIFLGRKVTMFSVPDESPMGEFQPSTPSEPHLEKFWRRAW